MPMNEDKILILQELLPLTSNPKSAADIHHYDGALLDRNTNLRLFKEAGGTGPTGDAQRLAFTKLVLSDVSAHVTLHMDLPQYQNFEELREARRQICEGDAQRICYGQIAVKIKYYL